MRLTILAAALALTLPALAAADDAAPQTAEQPAKVKKLCRYTPAPTGSNRPGKRRCRTAEQWQIEDRETRQTGDIAAGTNGAPARSQSQNNN